MVPASGLLTLCVVLVVGRETVLASAGHEMRCGRRLVSGLFSRPRLPLGYSYVTTVPRGACRLNVSEIISSDNYIALKISNGSYIMNGEFAVSAPGTYEAAGTRFLYSRTAGLDHVFALGPIHHPIDIMILYTQPNPSIKYEYLTESLPGEIESDKTDVTDPPPIVTKHSRRHHSFDSPRSGARYPDLSSLSKEGSNENVDQLFDTGSRKFMWKVLSYTQCTRTCGGGIQLGKYRCVESSVAGDREVSSVHCTGTPPIGKRRRCGMKTCPPRWRAAAWSACPRCGPAMRTRIVGCVQDHSRGITKISDQKCPPMKPSTTEKCNVPDCDNLGSGEVRRIESKRVRARDHIDSFRGGPVISVALNNTNVDVGPEYSFNTAAGWLFTEWSECIGWCVGGGLQTRNVRCGDPSGCAPRKAPESSRSCTPNVSCEPQDGQWFTGEWSSCSASCDGKQVRGVLCIGGTGRHLRDSACRSPKPEHERKCGGDCSPTWYFSDWGMCIVNCTSGTQVGIQKRTVVCTRDDASSVGVANDADCGLNRPHAHRTCESRCGTYSTLPPELTIESQKIFGYDTTTTTTTVRTPVKVNDIDCEDKLNNCALAVQARLCHYNFYIQNCCNSCYGR